MSSLCRGLGGHVHLLTHDSGLGRTYWFTLGDMREKHAWKWSHRLGALTVYVPVLTFLLGPGLEVGVTAIVSA